MNEQPSKKKRYILTRILILVFSFFACIFIADDFYPDVDGTSQMPFWVSLLCIIIPILLAIYIPRLFPTKNRTASDADRLSWKAKLVLYAYRIVIYATLFWFCLLFVAIHAPDFGTKEVLLIFVVPLIPAILIPPKLTKKNKTIDIEPHSDKQAENRRTAGGHPTTVENLMDDMDHAADVIFDVGFVSASVIQRRLKWEYSRVLKAIDNLENAGVVGPFQGSASRPILMTKEQYFSKRAMLKPKNNLVSLKALDVEKIISEEEEWRRQQYNSSVLYELHRIDGMDGNLFENWCADILRKIGYADISITQVTNDQGVDVIATKDGIRYAIQCKCYTSDLGNRSVQEVHTGKYISLSRWCSHDKSLFH